LKALGHCAKRSWVIGPTQAAPPRHPLGTAPKEVETHPGDGRLSFGNASIPFFHIYHAWLSQPACLTDQSQKEVERRTDLSTTHNDCASS